MHNLTRPLTLPITTPLTQSLTGAWRRGAGTPQPTDGILLNRSGPHSRSINRPSSHMHRGRQAGLNSVINAPLYITVTNNPVLGGQAQYQPRPIIISRARRYGINLQSPGPLYIIDRLPGTLDWDDDTTDDTPDFTYTATDLVENDTARLEWYSDVGLTQLVGFSENPVSAGEAGAMSINFVVGTLAGTYYFRAKHFPSGGTGTWSNTEVVTIAMPLNMRASTLVKLSMPVIIRSRRPSIIGQRNGLLLDVTPATWNPSDKHANVTLTNGNLTADTTANGDFNVRATGTGLNTGKRYHEIVIDVALTAVPNIGFADTSVATNVWMAGSTTGLSYASDGFIYFGGTAIATVETYAGGDVLCFAIDFGNNKIWVRKNGGNWNNNPTHDPATNTGGASIGSRTGTAWLPAVAPTTIGKTKTARFNPASWTQAAPSTFAGWIN